MATIWLVNNVKDDVSKALSWGELRFVNIRYIYADELSDDHHIPPDFQIGLQRAADEFDPERDYLLIAGDHLQLVVFSALLGMRYENFRVLRWDRQAEGYVPVHVVLPIDATSVNC